MLDERKNERKDREKFYRASLNAEICKRLKSRTWAESEKALLSLNFSAVQDLESGELSYA